VLIQTSSKDDNGKEENGLGSGVVISDVGDFLTSLHVVIDAQEVELTFADGSQSTAEILVAQAENDIAVLKADQPPSII